MAESLQAAVPEASSTAPPTTDAWKALGRDSPAGKALFRMYNGDFNGKQAGNVYHDQNRQRHVARVAAGKLPSPPPPPAPVIERPHISYPKFGRVKHEKQAAVASVPRRKPAHQIFAELQQDRERAMAQRPVPVGPLLDDREKDRCALMMQCRGKPPDAATIQQKVAKVLPGPLSEKQELSKLFQQVVEEIEERKQFLQDLQVAGKLKRDTQHQITYEIKQRVQDLERLDQLIHSCEEDRQSRS